MTPHEYVLNSPDTFITDALRGFLAANPSISWEPDPGFLHRRRAPDAPRVGVISGGGTGHEPMHAGLIGDGMIDAACPGLVFTSPNALQVTGATRWADQGQGVLHIVKNYTGDVMNFRIARHLLRDEVATDHVLVDDDVATESESGPGRRGTGATIIVEKVCGAAAARGDDLPQVAEIGRRTAQNSRSFAVAYRACTIPGATGPTFDLEADEMEFGVGIHGEAGEDRTARVAASELVGRMLDRIADSLALTAGERMLCLVNGLGSAHPLELSLVFGEVVSNLDARDVVVERSMVGTFVTALDMAGFSITLVRLDDETLDLFDADTTAPAWPARIGRGPARVSEVTFAEPDDAADDGPEAPWLSAFIRRVRDAIDELTALDQQAGDGDFGANMTATLDHFDLPVRGSDADVLRAISTSFLVRAGGTSGAVFGVLFRHLATAFSASDDIAGALRDGTAAALAEIQDLGGADVGDNTMVDALAPASDALTEGKSLSAVADDAEAGAESTRHTTASKGRASYVGENARGVVDPGALVTGWLYRAAAE
ncbi:dihydroxyacetone kinase family protein [Gordonia sp. ABSL11-1]|uniref:dihydroxyacetone kinase family protein n=1 Tax=Gordonia sp. ABSL11-1 TaxID=3053924 RepID=UPI0025743925|nr:dihydroxyacetone kinase family protein [Gordonia sp. ABSL11-1]MDL9946426.1 dihydroxyacetone kinase family protein [Gordonia sp. ABSL11-1]